MLGLVKKPCKRATVPFNPKPHPPSPLTPLCFWLLLFSSSNKFISSRFESLHIQYVTSIRPTDMNIFQWRFSCLEAVCVIHLMHSINTRKQLCWSHRTTQQHYAMPFIKKSSSFWERESDKFESDKLTSQILSFLFSNLHSIRDYRVGVLRWTGSFYLSSNLRSCFQNTRWLEQTTPTTSSTEYRPRLIRPPSSTSIYYYWMGHTQCSQYSSEVRSAVCAKTNPARSRSAQTASWEFLLYSCDSSHIPIRSKTFMQSRVRARPTLASISITHPVDNWNWHLGRAWNMQTHIGLCKNHHIVRTKITFSFKMQFRCYRPLLDYYYATAVRVGVCVWEQTEFEHMLATA